MSTDTTITQSSGNVFADIGFDESEARVLAMRADLMVRLEQTIKVRKLKQAAVGDLLGVSQGRVSDLVRHKVSKFSLDMLVGFAAKLDMPARLVFDAPKRGVVRLKTRSKASAKSATAVRASARKA